MTTDAIAEDFNLVEAGMYSGEVRQWAAKARGLAELLAVYSDGTVKGRDLVVAHYALECYAALIEDDKRTEAEHNDFARRIIRDHCYSLAGDMIKHDKGGYHPPRHEDFVHLSVFENTLVQRALRRYSKFLLAELKAQPPRAKAA